jgi:hypothetical protein
MAGWPTVVRQAFRVSRAVRARLSEDVPGCFRAWPQRQGSRQVGASVGRGAGQLPQAGLRHRRGIEHRLRRGHQHRTADHGCGSRPYPRPGPGARCRPWRRSAIERNSRAGEGRQRREHLVQLADTSVDGALALAVAVPGSSRQLQLVPGPDRTQLRGRYPAAELGLHRACGRTPVQAQQSPGRLFRPGAGPRRRRQAAWSSTSCSGRIR